jgi:ParB/RepB/Spo0J family partition protein
MATKKEKATEEKQSKTTGKTTGKKTASGDKKTKDVKKKPPTGQKKTTADDDQAAASAEAPVSVDAEFRLLNMSQIKIGQNYRKTVSESGMDELTASVRSKGVIQPVLVRPSGPIISPPELRGQMQYFLVAGRRRYLAAQRAELKNIPAMIRELSDVDALEIQVIENTQREDPNPLEEGWGFAELIEKGKHTVETLAAKLDKSADYVLRRIKLTLLPEAAQEKIGSGELSIGHALLITRLKHLSEQKEFLKMLMSQDMTVRDAQSRMRNFSSDIQDAVFDTSTCQKCAYLSSNQTALFPELKKSGQCMDRGCYFAKTRDYYQDIIAARRNEGFKIISYSGAGQKTIDELRYAYGGRGNMLRIAETDDYPAMRPRRYKTECMECKENHAYYVAEGKNHDGGKRVDFGEICLNKKCFNKMNNSNAGDSDNDSDTPASDNNRYKVQEARRRFLNRVLPERIQASPTLQKRLCIHHLLTLYGNSSAELRAVIGIYHKPMPEYDYDGSRYYFAVMSIPEELLDTVIGAALAAAVPETSDQALTLMLAEAGVDLGNETVIDEEYLKARQKPQLLELLKELGLDVMTSSKILLDSAEGKDPRKADIIEAIPAQDLRGKMSKAFIEAFDVEKIIGNARDDENQDELTCDICGRPGDDLGDQETMTVTDDGTLCPSCMLDKQEESNGC